MEPLSFRILLSDFDVDVLPVGSDLLKDDPERLREAVTDFFVRHFRKIGGRAQVASDGKTVSIQWYPDALSGRDAIVDYSIELLRQGDYGNAEPLLRTILSRYPEDSKVLMNYGMMLSDVGRLDEAVEHLSHASRVTPDSADVWNALGVAYQRRGDRDSAKAALKRSEDIEPDNPYMLRNLGALLADDSPEHALAYLEKAVELLPDDQQAGYGYALCLHQLGRFDEADSVLIRVIEIAPHTEVAERCRELRTDIAQKNLRGAVGGGLRPDVVMYCVAALEKAAEVGPEEMQRITFEIALLGRSGLDINDPAQKYQLKSLPGKFSGLQLLSYMYVGFRQLDRSMETGADFSKEYREAERLLETGK